MAKLIIEAGRAEGQYWRDLWRYRELFYFLSWRDLIVRYKQTVIGFAWAIIRPLATMIVFAIIFGRVANMKAKVPADIPYPLIVFAGNLPWQFFANALSESGNSLVGNANLISKVYFPRLVVPGSSVIVSFVDFLISFVILIGLFIFYYFHPDYHHFLPSWRIAWLPLLSVFAFLTALGPGLLITALNVQYRDFRYIVPFIVQFGLYVSPVGIPSSAIPAEWRLLYSMNPMVGVIDTFRWAICGMDEIYVPGLVLSVVITAVFLWIGVKYFRKTEKTFVDVI